MVESMKTTIWKARESRIGKEWKWIGIALVAGCSTFSSAQVFGLNLNGQDPSTSNTSKLKDKSHSHYAGSFNSGPRQHAVLLPGQGNAHFPITCKNPLTQKFFDQGLNQLYSF